MCIKLLRFVSLLVKFSEIYTVLFTVNTSVVEMSILCKVVNVLNIKDAIPPTFSSDTETVHFKTMSLENQGSDFFIIVNPPIEKFKITDNVRKYDKYKIDEGLLYIGFYQPEKDLLLCCSPGKLKKFFRAVEMIMYHRPQRTPKSNNQQSSTSAGKSTEESEKRIYLQNATSPAEFMLMSTNINRAFELELSEFMSDRFDERLLTYPFLSELHVCRNRLTDIPEEIGSMPSLKVLNLGQNFLGRATGWKWLTSPIISENLRILDLSSNELTKISESVVNLRKLQCLNLSDNSIQELPTSFGKLRNLEFLFINKNKLKFFPGTIRKLRNLNSIYMRENNLNEGYREYTDENPELTKQDFGVKSLLRTAAETLFRVKYPYMYTNMLPDTVANYLQYAVKYCNCGRPIFDENARSFFGTLLIYTKPDRWATRLGGPDTNSRLETPARIYVCSYRCYTRFIRLRVEDDVKIRLKVDVLLV